MSFGAHRISRDLNKFNDLVKGKIKNNLRKFMSQEEIIGKKGKDTFSIPLPTITIPKFTFGNNSGIGQSGGDGSKDAGKDPADHPLEAEVSLDQMADLLGEELKLPKIKPKGQKIIVESKKYTGVKKIGPESLRSFKTTYKAALRRALMAGDYDPDNPILLPIKDDRRYKSSEPLYKPQSRAIILYLMDISGSMGAEEKMKARLCSFWVETWLKKNYSLSEFRYIVHDTVAKEVNQEDFYRIRESGGTKISSAFELAKSIIDKDYASNDSNIYIFQYSDGDDWSPESSEEAITIIKSLLPRVNQINYCQVKEGNGYYLNAIESHKLENLVSYKVKDRDNIYDAIKAFFKEGR